MRRTRCMSLVVFLSFTAHAEERPLERAKESFKAGATAYAAGDYLAAIQALDAAYELTPLPAIAFSLAQAERRQYFVDREREHLDRAIALFRAYVDRLPGGGRRADALDALSQLEPLAMALGRAEPSPKPKTEDAARRTRLMVASSAPHARVSLDGGPETASPFIREVPAGKHRAHVEADGFYPTDRDVIAVAGELIMTEVPLAERPSTLVLWTRKDAELYVDGAFVGAGGARVTVQLPSGTHRLAVAENGYRVAYRTLALERGGAMAVRVPLEPTTQRWASRLLFIAGGAGLGVGLILGAFAIRAEDRAEDFLGKQAWRNVTTAELSEYKEAIGDRNLFRAAAASTLAAAGSLFITGFFLHELDRPNARELRREPGAPGSRRAPTKTEIGFRLVPLLGQSTYGAAIGAGF